MLFSDRSLWTMLHGVVLGGGALMALAAALVLLRTVRVEDLPPRAIAAQARSLARLTLGTAIVLWLTVLVGTYIVFPPYRATPPDGALDLARYPRALLLASPRTAWLHAFAMEIKEHVPWIASMLATAVAFAAVRYRSGLLRDAPLRAMATTLLAICFVLVAVVALLGVLVSKAAPLQ